MIVVIPHWFIEIFTHWCHSIRSSSRFSVLLKDTIGRDGDQTRNLLLTRWLLLFLSHVTHGRKATSSVDVIYCFSISACWRINTTHHNQFFTWTLVISLNVMVLMEVGEDWAISLPSYLAKTCMCNGDKTWTNGGVLCNTIAYQKVKSMGELHP